MRALVALGIALVAAVTASAAGGADRATARLRLDGVPIRPEIALTSAQRSLGLMHRTKAPADGMLFVFPSRTRGGFWMKNTLVPLKIVFFDVGGKQVRTLRMAPCLKDPCPVYDPGKPYRFALELPSTDARRATRLGPLASLRALTSRSS